MKIKKIDIENLHSLNKNIAYLWDSSLPGFGVRCTNKGIKSYVLRYRQNGIQRIKTLSRIEILDLTDARERARKYLNDIQQNIDPFVSSKKDILTIRDLSVAFQDGRKDELKTKTLKSYESLWIHINKALGGMPITALNDDAVAKLKKHFNAKQTSYNRSLSLIISALKWQGLAVETHPFKLAKKFKEKPRQRILSIDENQRFYEKLIDYKKNKKTGWRYVDLFLLLLLTGLRRDEWRLGQWNWIDWNNCLYVLPDNKTGGRTVYLSSFAIDILKQMHDEQKNPNKGFIFTSAKANNKKPLAWTWRVWNEMRNDCGIAGFRIHDMRHTAGSYAHSHGKLSQRQVADFLGHSRLETSSRYIHDDEKRKSSEIAGASIAETWKK